MKGKNKRAAQALRAVFGPPETDQMHCIGTMRLGNEAAFREEVLLACVLIPCALLLGLPAVETVLLIGSVLLLMLVEILNSAIEAVVDRIGPELHPLSGRAKDLGSAAVFIAMIILGVTWLLIAAPALWAFLAG